MLKRFSDNLSNGFQDFPGLSITGSLPLKQELINETLAEVLQTLAAETGPATGSKPTQGSPGLQLQQLAKMVRSCSVSADAGVLTLNFEIRR